VSGVWTQGTHLYQPFSPAPEGGLAMLSRLQTYPPGTTRTLAGLFHLFFIYCGCLALHPPNGQTSSIDEVLRLSACYMIE
jgi:hypothetical protein